MTIHVTYIMSHPSTQVFPHITPSIKWFSHMFREIYELSDNINKTSGIHVAHGEVLECL